MAFSFFRALLFAFALFSTTCVAFLTTNPAPFFCESATSVEDTATQAWTTTGQFCSGIRNVTASVDLTNAAKSISQVLLAKIAVPYQVPADFSIQGVEVKIFYQLTGTASLSQVQLYSGSNAIGQNKAATPEVLDPQQNSVTVGGNNDLWGASSFDYSSFALGLQAASGSADGKLSLTFLEVRLYGDVNVLVIDVYPKFQVGAAFQNNLEVTVVGANFVDLTSAPNAIQCRFGSKTAPVATLTDSRRIKCKPPEQDAPGYYPVAVDLGAGYTNKTTVVYIYKEDGVTGATCGGSPPCSGHGVCNELNNECSCDFGYTGATCDTPACSLSPYQQCDHGTCQVISGIPQCVCDSGYEGANCSYTTGTAPTSCLDRNGCSGSSNGNCVADECVCNSGYRGVACDFYECTTLSDCNPPYGECTGSEVCTCNPTLGGAGAECAPDCVTSCQYGSCGAPDVCLCPPGKAPPFCTTDIEIDCSELNNCTGNGVCFSDPLKGSPFCSCDPYWLGANCSRGDCSVKNNCSYPNGECVGANLCKCAPGWIGTDCGSQQPEQIVAPAANNATLGIALGVVFGVLFLVAVLFAVLLYLYCTRSKGRRRRKLAEPNYTEVAFSVDSKSKFSLDPKVADLEKLILAHDHILLTSITNVTQSTEADNLSKGLVYLFCAHGRGLELMKLYIDAELNTSDSANTLFRANSMSTKMFKVYSKVLGLPYLWKMLAHHIDGIIQASLEQEAERKEAEKIASKGGSVPRSSSINNFELEIDPSKMEEGSDQIANKFQLLLICQKIFTSITRSLEYMPPTLRAVIAHVKSGTERAFPGSEYKALGGFLFLRFICPALVAPHTYGLTANPPTSGVQRQLVLLSKILQNLANEAEFGAKEEYMAKLNAFVHDNKPELVKFYAKIVSNEDPPDHPTQMPSGAKENAVGFLHEHVIVNLDKINAELDTQQDGTRIKSELKSVLDSLSPPQKK